MSLLTAALALARGAYFTAAMLLFGGLALRVMMRTRLPHIVRRPIRGGYWAVGGAVAAALTWFALATAQMAGDPAAMLDLTSLAAAGRTQFGIGFAARLAAMLLTAAALASGRDVIALALAGIALATPALSSHAAASSPAHFAAIGVVIDGLHLLAAGFWIGGLAMLLRLFARGTAKADLLLILHLFSEAAMVAVLLLAMSGLINSTLVLLGGPGALSPFYLTVLGIKLACVAAMLALAAINRFRLMPDFLRAQDRLGRNVARELALGIAVLALAGLLGQLAPTLG